MPDALSLCPLYLSLSLPGAGAAGGRLEGGLIGEPARAAAVEPARAAAVEPARAAAVSRPALPP
jgi:hypothetical protein